MSDISEHIIAEYKFHYCLVESMQLPLHSNWPAPDTVMVYLC